MEYDVPVLSQALCFLGSQLWYVGLRDISRAMCMMQAPSKVVDKVLLPQRL
jgi:hypothetical protein